MAGLFDIGGSGNKTDRKTELNAWGALNTIGDWANTFGQNQATQGANNLTTAGNFFNTLLSGNPVATAQVLSPEISTVQNQTQQKLDTTQQFNNRSGGTNESLVATGDTGTASIQQLIATLLGQSGQEVANIGTTQESLGQTAVNEAAKAFSTIASQAGDDRTTFAGPLQQSQQGSILSTLINANIPGLGGNSLNDILGL